MKHLNKLLNGIIAAVSAFAMALVLIPTGALAADATYKLTLNGTAEGHTYEAYQIFTGDLSNGTLSNIKWGSGVANTDALITALKSDNTLKATFGDVKDAASVAEALSKASDNDAVAKKFAQVVSQYLSTTPTASQASAKDATTISGLSAGYYLVKDKDNSLANTNPGAYTRFIMKVVGNAEATVKSSVPTVTKKVKDTNDSTGVTSDWQDSADADVNDSVSYKITGTLPTTYGDYSKYSYVFTDTMSKGLTYTAGNAVITLYANATDAAAGTNGTVITKHFTEAVYDYTGTDTNYAGGKVITWTEKDANGLKDIADVTKDSVIVVTYNATLNSDAKLGSAGNPNKVDLTFSNNPNHNGEGSTSKTPEDKNIVFTYKTVVNKVDQNQQSLKGAGFKLEKKQSDGTYTTVKTFTAGDETTFEFSGLDDGTYKLTETETPAGYNTIAPVEFTISATHSETADDPQLLTLSGDVTSGTANFTADTSKGSLTTNVVNKKGSVLPSTGGMGTTVLYVAGAAIIVAAGLGLAKRRSAHKDAE